MTESDPRTPEEAVEAFLAARERGEDVDPVAFAARFAHLGDELRDAIDALAELQRSSTRAPRAVRAERIGPYRILREIGRGGMGVVLEAIEEPLGRRVALKLLSADAVGSSAARLRFAREAALAARLDHPGIATVYGTGIEGDEPWIAMRYVEGETLSVAIARAREDGARCAVVGPPEERGRGDALAVAACIAQVARALQAAHDRGVVHRDVKPSNVIVGADGTPVLVDFGLALNEEVTGTSLTRTGDTAGTPAYIAPEIVGGERGRPDAQSDVYALGVTLYECLTLRRPFDGATPLALYHAITSSSATDVRALNAGVSRDLATVVAVAMERDRARRYATAAALADDLEACVADEPIRARPLPLHGRILRWARREPRQAVLAAALVVATLALAGFGGSWWSSRGEVRAAESFASRRAYESALEEGFSALDRARTTDADAAFERALAIDPVSDEASGGRELSSVVAADWPSARARLAAVSTAMPGRDALEALAVEAAPPPRRDADLAVGVGSFELYIRGRCVLMHTIRLTFRERAPGYRRAFELFSGAVARAPAARAIYHQQLAAGAQQVGDAAVARSASAALVSLWPDSPRALRYAGHALLDIDPAAARFLLERSLAIEPTLVDAYNLIASTFHSAGAYDEVEAWARRGLAVDPDDAALHVILANSLTFRGCNDESMLANERAYQLNPKLDVAWSQCAFHAFAKGDLRDALDLYAMVVWFGPGNHSSRLFYAAALERDGDHEASAHQADIAIAGLYPWTVREWQMVSAVCLQLGAAETAASCAEAGLSVAPDDGTLRGLRAQAWKTLGR